MHWSEPAFWFAAWQIILINFVLSGDNAVVIALACRSLPRRQRVWGMVFGACAAVLLRIAFVMTITAIMDFPLLKLAGGILLLWIAIKLVVPAVSHAQENVAAACDLWNAVKIVAVADVVMSLDNVIAIAAAAKGSWLLIIFGLAVSVPLIVAGSALLVSVLDRYPIASWGGAALLGWIAGQIIIEDPAVAGWIREPGDAIALVAAGLGAGPAGATHLEALQYGAATAGAAFVVTVGHFVARRRRSHPSHGAGEDAAISDEPRIDPAVASRDRAG